MKRTKTNNFQLYDTNTVKIEINHKDGLFYVYCDLDDWESTLKNYTWYISKDNNGHAYYARTTIELERSTNGKRRNKKLYMHRMIMNTPDGQQVDHIDWDGRNNCKSNLRNCSPKENSANRRYNMKNTPSEEYPLPSMPPF